MNTLLFIAAILSAVACVAHGVLGQKAPVQPMLQTDISQVSKLELAGVWHLVTLGFGLTSVALFTSARAVEPSAALLQFLVWQFVLYGVAIFVIVIWQRGSLLKVPQWLLMWIIAALIYWS